MTAYLIAKAISFADRRSDGNKPRARERVHPRKGKGDNAGSVQNWTTALPRVPFQSGTGISTTRPATTGLIVTQRRIELTQDLLPITWSCTMGSNNTRQFRRQQCRRRAKFVSLGSRIAGKSHAHDWSWRRSRDQARERGRILDHQVPKHRLPVSNQGDDRWTLGC